MGPPKAAIWTQQVVELPPIASQKRPPSMMFEESMAESQDGKIRKLGGKTAAGIILQDFDFS